MKQTLRYAVGALLIAGLAMPAAHLAAEEPAPVLLILDRDALDHGPPPHPIPGEAVNDLIASVGVRDQLPYFANNIGAPLTLLGGQNGSDGWFAVTAAPEFWATAPGAGDGLENFVLAGPGLGSPDRGGDRESLLWAVPGVQPLHGAGLRALVGRQACAVVYDNDLQVVDDPSAAADLRGPNLGLVAFEVLAVDALDGSDWPKIEVQILDAKEVCSGPMSAFGTATN